MIVWKRTERNGPITVLDYQNSHGDKGAIFFKTVEDAKQYVPDQPGLHITHLKTEKEWWGVIDGLLKHRDHNGYFEAVREGDVWRMDAVAFVDLDHLD